MEIILLLLLLVLALPIVAFPYPKQQQQVDVYIVLGCPIKEDGSFSITLKNRLDHVLSINQNQTPIIVCGGSAHNQYNEAQQMKQYLVTKTNTLIHCEDQSKTTYENMKFSKVICEQYKYQNIGIVTSMTHCGRAYALSKKFYHHIAIFPAKEPLSIKKLMKEYMARVQYGWIEYIKKK